MNPEDAPAWRRSSRCSNEGNCVELRRTRRVVAVRDSKNPGGPVLELELDAAAGLLTAIREADRG